MSALRSVLKTFFRGVVSLYFREVEVVGEVPTAATRGRLFGANHFNGLIDPVLVLTAAPPVISPIAKSTLWKVPGLRWLLDAVAAVPVVRRKDDPSKPAGSNDEVFARVSERFVAGGNVLIFPEGVSHSKPFVAPLKTGGARMLAHAHASGAAGLTFQAVGLEFDARDVFRSRALLRFGPVRSVDALGVRDEALVDAITTQLHADLSQLIVEGATWEDRRLIARVAELFADETGDHSLAGWNAIGQRVEAARKALGPEHDALYREVAGAVGGYYAALAAAGLTDRDVIAGDAPARGRTKRAAWLALTLPLAIPGAVLYWLPYQLPRLFARRLAGGDHDVVSTYKLATGLVVFPLWAAGLALGALALLPLPLALPAAVGAVVTPMAALYWLDFLEQRRGPWRGSPPGLAQLRTTRATVSALLSRIRAAVEPAGVAA